MTERRPKADPALRYLQRMQADEPAPAAMPGSAVPGLAVPGPAAEKRKKPGQLDKLSQFVADYPVGSAEADPDPDADIRTNGIRKRTQEVITQAYEVALQRDSRRHQEQRSRMAGRVVLTRPSLAALLLCTAGTAFGAGWWLAPKSNRSASRQQLAAAEAHGEHGAQGAGDSDSEEQPVVASGRAMWCSACQKWSTVPPEVLLGRTGGGIVCPRHKIPLLAEKPPPQRDPSRPN